MRLPAILRGCLLLLLGVALYRSAVTGADEPARAAAVHRLDDEADLARVLIEARPPALLVRDSPDPPKERELELLEALGERSAMLASLPPKASMLKLASVPARMRAGRGAALVLSL